MEMSAERVRDDTAAQGPAKGLDDHETAAGFSLNDGQSEAMGAAPVVGSWTPPGETASAPDEDAVIAAIATVFDPEIPVNIYELGLIYAVDLHEDGRVKVEMTLTAPGCPSAQELPVQVRDAVLLVGGVTACEVETVWDPPWDASRMSEDARLALNMF